MQASEKRAWVEIDLGALQRNAAAIAQHARARLLPMIKADAYGLGAIPVARVLEPLEPWGYGVATILEGIELRAAGIARPILIFSPLAPEELGDVRAAGVTPSLARAGDIARWRTEGGGAWHLAIDTGMSRAGVRWDEVDDLRDAIAACPPEGAYTHFHSAELNDPSLEQQAQRFRDAIAVLPEHPKILHAENSAAVARLDNSGWDCVRPGIFLYGVGSGEGARLHPQPVVQVYARVVDLRRLREGDTVSYDATYRAVGDRRVATLGIGYADGYPRSLSNRGGAILGGRRACIAGLVTMDMTMVDVTDVPCTLGDVATVIGAGDGLDVAAVARTAEMSPYELLTGLRNRIARVYRSEGTRS
jgi:alanine racemase